MKKLILLYTLLSITSFCFAEDKIQLTFKYVFLNSKSGFTYPTKVIIERNGAKIAESSVKDQAEKNQVSVHIPKGKATIKATLYALSGGKWEARVESNNYSYDCVYEKNREWNDNIIIKMTVDINKSDISFIESKGISNDNDVNENIDYAAEKAKLDSYKSNVDVYNWETSTSTAKTNSKGNYQVALQKLNDYLKTFDNGYYGYFEVKDGYIYDRFKAGKYNKFKMEDMEGAVIQEQYNRVIFKCKGDNKCISTDWKTNGQEEYTQFVTTGKYNYLELADLLNNFRDAYLGKSKTTTSSNTDKSRDIDAINRQKAAKKNNTSNNNDDDYDEDWDALEAIAAKTQKQIKEAKTTSTNGNAYQVPLQKLNEYLKTFNAETYRDIEVKNGKVYFAFFVYGTIYKSSIDINELKNNTIITIGKSVGSFKTDQVKISCKSESKCFYSAYSNENTDHFRFFSHSVNDFTKMEQLVNDFIKAL